MENQIVENKIMENQKLEIQKMKIADIQIAECFAITTPAREKYDKCLSHWEETNKQDRYIVVTSKGILTDGYIQYLVLKNKGVETADVVVSDAKSSKHKRMHKENNKENDDSSYDYRKDMTTYIYGRHTGCKREYTWRLPKGVNREKYKVGSSVYVHTKYGKSPITITSIIITSECPSKMDVKTVVAKR